MFRNIPHYPPCRIHTRLHRIAAQYKSSRRTHHSSQSPRCKARPLPHMSDRIPRHNRRNSNPPRSRTIPNLECIHPSNGLLDTPSDPMDHCSIDPRLGSRHLDPHTYDMSQRNKRQFHNTADRSYTACHFRCMFPPIALRQHSTMQGWPSETRVSGFVSLSPLVPRFEGVSILDGLRPRENCYVRLPI
jgi:hypothetical protein